MPDVLDDWYVSGEHARRAIMWMWKQGHLSSDIQQDFLGEWGYALESTIQYEEASPVSAAVVEKGLQHTIPAP